jgi:putative addiction module killer protein
MANQQWRVSRYAHEDGSEPFSDWLNGLDIQIQRRIRLAIARLEAGNFSSVKWIAGNLGEYRIDTGPGYRIYFTRHGRDQMVVLIGGDKASQTRDIRQAKVFIELLKLVR